MDRMRFNFAPTGIGSLPHKTGEAAARAALTLLEEIPYWPQLPQRTFLEGMGAQFAEGLPGAVTDLAGKRVYVDTSGGIEHILTEFYQHYLADDLGHFAITSDRAASLKPALEGARKAGAEVFKGHVTGPITFAGLMQDEKGDILLHHPDLNDLVTKHIAMKARWQTRLFKEAGFLPVVFLDEPYLISYGSAFNPLNREQVLAMVGECAKAIKDEGGLSGIHCCGSTDWGLLTETGVDILSFDAYGYMDQFLIYTADIGKFVKAGGCIAWGAAPSMEMGRLIGVGEITAILRKGITRLAEKGGVDPAQTAAQSMITPSCGLGMMLSEKGAEDRLRLLGQVAQVLRIENKKF